MSYTVIMLLGMLVGAKLLPVKWLRANTILQITITVLLLFTMGVSFGARPSFLQDLRTAGVSSFLYAAIPGAGAVLAVYILSKIFLGEKKQ